MENKNKTYKKFEKNFDYNKSLLKPELKQYYDELQSLYVDRKVTNIKTIENLFNQLTSKASRFAIEKINKLKYELPNYIETPTTKQSKEDRLKKYESKYIEQGYIKENNILHKDNKIYKIKDGSLVDVTEKRMKIKIRNALQGSFSEIIIKNEPLSKNETPKKIIELNKEAIIKHKENYKEASIDVISNLVFLNNISQVVYKQIIKQFINNSDNKIKLLCSFNIKYLMTDGDDLLARYFTSSFATALLSPNQIKEFCDDEINRFFNSLVDCNGRSGLFFHKVKNVTIQIAKRQKTRAGKFIELPTHINNKKAIVNIKNDDDKCILYCLAAYFNYDTIKSHHKSEPSTYKKYLSQVITPENQKFPIDIQHDIPKFEKLNDIKINVFTYDKKYENLKILYNTNKRNEKCCNLLYIEKDDIQHLAYIKDINKLLRVDDKNKVHHCA